MEVAGVPHNLRGYDGHMIVKAIKNKYGKTRIIPTNFEKFMSIQVGRVLFLDSFQFASQGLDNLVKTLAPGDFKQTRSFFGIPDSLPPPIHHCHREGIEEEDCSWCTETNIPFERAEQLFRKGVFFYDYFDGIARLKETKLPDQPAFYNRLSDEECTPADHAYAHRVWKLQGC